MALRPTTNLIVPPHLMMPKKALKEKFLYVYTGAYSGAPTAFMTKLWAAPFFPSVTNDAKFGKIKPRLAADALGKRMPSGYLRVKKIMDSKDPHFIASVPLFTFIRHSPSFPLEFLRSFLLGEAHAKKESEPTAQTIQESRDFVENISDFNATSKDRIDDQIIPTSKVIESMRLDALGAAALQACLLKVRIQTKGNLAVIFADFKITKEEAQQLTTTEWTELRDIDLYPLLLHWVTVGFGAKGIAPIAAFPVSKIAFSLPPSHSESARINEFSLSVGPNGKPYYLPKAVDKQQTIAYEDKYSQAGSRDDGSFALHDINEGATFMDSGQEVKTRLPVNMVVCVDWLNNKYAYTNTSGLLDVEDLTRFQKMNISHARTLLDERKLTDKDIIWFVNLGIAAGVTQEDFRPLAKDIAGVEEPFASNFQKAEKSPIAWFEESLRAFFKMEEKEFVVVSDISINGFPPFAALARYFKKIEAAVKDNIEAVYLKYSIQTVMTIYPWLVMMAHYCDDMQDVRAKDLTMRKAALNQNVDPKWKMPSVPLVGKDLGLLPHQVKVQNLMKDDPDLALMPVQAGGGKTPLLLIDLLLRYKENTSSPYLVLCPNHLVPNYVKEAVYFTAGKLNVIAITNVAIRQNGWKRLQAIVEAAPRNTVVVVALDTLRFRPRAVSYGTSPTIIFPVIDFLRQFSFGYVAIDEAHRIKGKTARNKAVMALISDIPKKRLASGTFVHDSPSDLALIVAALDPTVFGTREEFNDTYGEVVRGERVVKWKEGAERAIMSKIKTRCVVAGAMRKEWAAFLPKKVEWVGGVDLTSSQQAVYEDILNVTIEEIEKDAATNKELQKFLKGKDKGAAPSKKDVDENDSGDYEEEQEGERAIDEDAGEDLAAALNPYLARLEQYLVAPGQDILGKQILKGADLMSPKVAMVYERIKLHLFGGEIRNPKTGQMAPYGPFPGKVIVFVNQIKAAEEIFNKAPPELKKYGLLYKASEKVEILSQLEKNPNKKWVVGVVQSMEEGLNLQFASRIIRVSSPWNPGNLEQSNARIERPEFKKAETRSQVFFDSIVADKTYDITKQARLIAKVIAAAKFENTDNPEYETIPVVQVVPMNLDTIRALNTWHYVNEENPGLITYAKALADYQKVRNDDYEEYKQAYIAKHGEGPVMSPIEIAPTPPDAKLLLRTPYVPGLGLYNENELGLVRIDEYLNIVPTSEDEEEEEDTEEVDVVEDENAPMTEAQQRLQGLKGQLVHTEFGDGYIRMVSGTSRFMSVELLNGYRVKVRKAQVFLITRSLTSNKDIRDQMLKMIGKLPATKPIDVPADSWKASKKAQEIQKQHEQKTQVKEQVQREEKKQKDLSIELTVFVANGFLGVDYFVDEANPTAMKVLQAHGFRTTPTYYYSRVPNHNALNNQMKLWKEKGLTMDKSMSNQGVFAAFEEMYALLKSGAIRNHKETYRATKAAQVVNFYRTEQKPSNKKEIFKPYPIIQDGIAYIALPTGQAGTREAMKFRRPAFKWAMSDATLSFFGTLAQVTHLFKTLIDAGVSISNVEELRKEVAKLKLMKVRDPKEGGLTM